MDKNLKYSLALICIAFSSLNSWAAGFDCSKASTAIEKLVCSDTSISALDADLNRLYKLEYEKSRAKEIFRETQILWLKSTRNLCATAECLADVYRERIQSLHQAIELRDTGIERRRVESSFTGTYCANPCYYQSNHRPVDMACRITLGEKYIFLSDLKKRVAKNIL